MKGGRSMDDQKIKQLLFERSDAALGEIAQKYSALYKSVLRQMLSNECDVEECENDLLLAVWNSIPPNDPQNLGSYLCTVARRISINRLKFNTRKKRSAYYTTMLSELGDCIPDNGATELYYEGEQLERILSDFISGLDADTRVLFIRRYIFMESVAELSKRFALKPNVISTKLFRARKKLEVILRKEGIDL
jgi:RNA polymerase sigma-70 factor (ECF subfamily)